MPRDEHQGQPDLAHGDVTADGARGYDRAFLDTTGECGWGEVPDTRSSKVQRSRRRAREIGLIPFFSRAVGRSGKVMEISLFSPRSHN